jgi:hypothetical protein
MLVRMYEISGRTGLRSLTWLLYGLDRTKERHALGRVSRPLAEHLVQSELVISTLRCAYSQLETWLENARNENGNEKRQLQL